MSTFPSVLTTYTNPTPTNKLNAPSHSGIETAQNGGLTQVEAVIGVEGSASVVGSLQYLIKSPASDGGGHVQSANKGGTGQTQYNKGDILVASGASILSKQAAGPDGNVVVYDSTQSTGLNNTGVATSTNIQNQTYVYAVASVLSASVYGITFPTAVTAASTGQAFAVKWPSTNTNSVLALQVSSLVAQRIVNPDLTNPNVGGLTSSMVSILENDGTNFQVASVQKILSGTTVYTNGTTTKNAADGSGTQNIAHGLGLVPKKIKISATLGTTIVWGGGSVKAIPFANTVYNGTTQSSQSLYGVSNDITQDQTFTLNISNGANKLTGVVTFDATNIIITWSATSSPTGTYNLLWEAEV